MRLFGLVRDDDELEPAPELEPELNHQPPVEDPAPPSPPPPEPAAAPPKLPARAPEAVRSNTYTLIYGAKGQGKTSLARAAYRARVERGGSAVFVDPKGENGWLGPRVIRSVAEFDNWWRAELRARRQLACIFQPAGWDDDMADLWRLLYEIGDLLLVLDEADIYAPANRIDTNLRHLVGKGRFKQLDVITTVRTPPELNGALTGNVDVAITFAQELPDYADVLARRFFPGRARAICELPRFHYLRRGPDNRVSLGVVRI